MYILYKFVHQKFGDCKQIHQHVHQSNQDCAISSSDGKPLKFVN